MRILIFSSCIIRTKIAGGHLNYAATMAFAVFLGLIIDYNSGSGN
ncbi:MAG: hypothetical protein PHX29_06635 [Dehalococcoidales bacterium]|nr:hypothetical protein [Dehalococcoidales bacterium]